MSVLCFYSCVQRLIISSYCDMRAVCDQCWSSWVCNIMRNSYITFQLQRYTTGLGFCALRSPAQWWMRLRASGAALPGTLLPGFGRRRLLEERAAVFKVLVVFLASLSRVDPLEASQVFGLVPLHLLHRGGLALTQLLWPTCTHTHTHTE